MPEIQAKDIDAAQFSAWRQHPVTKIFREFLRGYARKMTEEAGQRWRAGVQDPNVEQFARGCVNALEEMAEVQWQGIAAFYGIEVKEEEVNDGKPPTE